MRVIRGTGRCPRPQQGTAVTIGAYDGVHLGHLAVIAELRRLAESRGLATAVVTFDRHPAVVVRPESAPKLLTDLDQKLELLSDTGVDYTLVVEFDEARSKEPPEDFVSEVITGCLNARAVAVGDDFHFGHQRRGNVALLRAMGAELGFDVDPLRLVGIDGRPAGEAERVSSTAIRTALAAGDLARATELLGRPYEMRGIVASARPLTVSVPDEICLPAAGRYRGWYIGPSGDRCDATVTVGQHVEVVLADDGAGVRVGETARVQIAAALSR